MDECVEENNSLRILSASSRAYYWKPYAAYFRWLEMSAYTNIGLKLNHPILDVGCGDGGVAKIMKDLRIVPGFDYGIDFSEIEVRKAKERGIHNTLMVADAREIPCDNYQFESVVCNGVICCIPEGHEKALAELHRVLAPGGALAMSVPTDKFESNLFVPKLLGIFSSQLAAVYTRRLLARLPHFTAKTLDEWADDLRNTGFEEVKTIAFFTKNEAKAWNIMTLTFFRAFGLLKLLPGRMMEGISQRAMMWIFPKLRDLEGADDPGEAGYMILVARKGRQ